MKPHHLYLVIMVAVFAALTAAIVLLPRSTYSELEKRDLKELPDFSFKSLLDHTFTTGISEWFSDTEPYRDQIMAGSMAFRHAMRAPVESEVRIVSSAVAQPPHPVAMPAPVAETQPKAEETGEEQEEGVAKIANGGAIVLVGNEPEVRAVMIYGGKADGGSEYAAAVNKMGHAFAIAGAKTYCMVVPNAAEFYLPASVKNRSMPQLPTINHIYSLLDADITGIDAYNALKLHRNEDIFLRTDHHWSPLGAFYAAKAFALTVGVEFPGLNQYDRKEIHRFVGSMYGYSRDASIKRSPENFVFFVPRLPFVTTYTDYELNRHFQITGEGKPHEGNYFQHFRDGSGNAYLTFMGTDKRLTVVQTGSSSPRKLLVVKDSYGNAVPGYLFHGFGEVHVVDFRYFPHSLTDYVSNHAITDVLIINNIYNAHSPSTARKLEKLL